MLTGPTVFAASLGYVFVLFFIAWWGDRDGQRFLTGGRRTLVYALSLAVYCTSWTYYGSVGLGLRARARLPADLYRADPGRSASGYRLIQRIAGLARDQNLTTVADFVSARYGKSQIVAALAALIALMASAPYIALQLKAITQTILMVLSPSSTEGSRRARLRRCSRSSSPRCWPCSRWRSARGGSTRPNISKA